MLKNTKFIHSLGPFESKFKPRRSWILSISDLLISARCDWIVGAELNWSEKMTFNFFLNISHIDRHDDGIPHPSMELKIFRSSTLLFHSLNVVLVPLIIHMMIIVILFWCSWRLFWSKPISDAGERTRLLRRGWSGYCLWLLSH